MHKPMTISELIEALSSINGKREVIVECGFNNYDIVELESTKNRAVLKLKLLHKRNDIDE